MNTSHPATDTPGPPYRPVADRLARLTAGRILAGERVVAAARAAGAGAVLVIGSLAERRGDAFSDLDLLIVTGPGYTGLEATRLFGSQLLTQVTEQPGAAPRGGCHTGICLKVAGVALWLDLVQWPAATAALPADSIIAYTLLDLPYSQLGYRNLLDHHADPATPTPTPSAATELRRVAEAAKHLARSNRRNITEQIPQAAGLPLHQIRPMLHQRLAAIDQPAMAAAIAATAALVDLADMNRTSCSADPTRRANHTTPEGKYLA